MGWKFWGRNIEYIANKNPLFTIWSRGFLVEMSLRGRRSSPEAISSKQGIASSGSAPSPFEARRNDMVVIYRFVVRPVAACEGSGDGARDSKGDP
jgi:hypothetical protein